MNGHAVMPDPRTEMRPQDLVKAIEDWAAAQGYSTEVTSASSEYAKVIVRDTAGGSTRALIPNAHHGRRLRRHQVRYVVQEINTNWMG
jgi:hypothetical protein